MEEPEFQMKSEPSAAFDFGFQINYLLRSRFIGNICRNGFSRRYVDCREFLIEHHAIFVSYIVTANPP